MNWHTTDFTVALDELKTNPKSGLTSSEARARLRKHGPNELVEKGGRRLLQILWEQLTATLVLTLILAAIAAGALGKTRDAIAILAIVILYVVLGFTQEYRAGQTIAALKKLAAPQVRAIRGSRLSELSARELVPGDIVLLETGDIIPADLRLLEAVNLQIQEAELTGESESVSKITDALEGEGLPLGDRRNMAYLGTVITGGRGRGVVVATGMETELGRIAGLIQQVGSERTPLQRRLGQLGKMLALVGVGIAALIIVLGIWRGGDLRQMLLTAVSVAVAIVPESLPAVVALTLALGAQRMLKRQALIRRLPAVEALGSVTVICSDKTGTLTQNRMTVMAVDVAEQRLDLSETMRGGSIQWTVETPLEATSAISLMAVGGALCNDAQLFREGDIVRSMGDPTEGALLVAAAKLGYWKGSLDSSFSRAAEVPFDSERKRMTTVHSLKDHDPNLLVGLPVNNANYIAFTKGSVDGLLEVSNRVWVQDEVKDLDESWRKRVLKANDEMTAKGMRVLGVALRLLDDLPAPVDATLESGLTLVGLFGMIDPPRSEVKDAVATCKAAGIRPVMITGDHPLTALEIARQLGIVATDSNVSRHSPQSQETLDSVITGAELDRLSFGELQDLVDEISVYARVSPEHKLRIVRALQSHGHIVSITGDSLNDAPALRRADIGVAMGLTGTDVSKEASDLVLLDDNFATIVAAVSEGRTISGNLRRFLRFLVAGIIGKALVMLLAPYLGNSIPLLPLQLLWLNLLTDGLLGLGMGVEGPEPPDGDRREAMNRPPYSPREGVFSRGGWIQVTWIGALIGALALALGAFYFFNGRAEWQTMVFTTLAFAQVFQALASRSSKESLFKIGVLSNPLLAGMALLVIVLQLAVLYIPALSGIFDVLPLSGLDLAIAAGAGVVVFVVMELEKIIKSSV